MIVQLKFFILLIFFTGTINVLCQDLYKTTTAKVSFFSFAPVENITATSDKGISVLNPTTGEISFLVKINSLQFPKSLMQEHFNENYMESDRYPTATFKGKILPPIDLSKNGEMKIVLSGILDIHGVPKKREIPGTLFVSKEQITLKTEFDVACEAHNIKIPKILWHNIAEVVQVKINANYKP